MRVLLVKTWSGRGGVEMTGRKWEGMETKRIACSSKMTSGEIEGEKQGRFL